nr:MAG TPA: hypothetical protein [Caudoviricetes sp.]
MKGTLVLVAIVLLSLIVMDAYCSDNYIKDYQQRKQEELLQDLNDGQNVQILLLQQILKQQQEINERLKK